VADRADPTAFEAEVESTAVPVPSPAGRRIEIEVDLTDRLNAVAVVDPAAAPAAAAPMDAVPLGAPPDSKRSIADQGLEGTFAAMRNEVAQSGADLVSLGRTYLSAGLPDQAIEAFETAAHHPAQRYEAAIALVEIFESRKNDVAVVEWLGRAADSAPSPAKRGAVLYRLGVALEQMGEPSRALAVLLELKAMAPAFRDVSARVARLEAAQAGGGSSTP
jgi:tetratricopeptide (TPR) repeat protein